MPATLRCSLLVPLTVIAMHGGSASAQKTYVAPTNATVFTETDQSQTQHAHTISVVNRSTVPVTVFGYTLTSCENIKQRCDEPQRIQLHVPGGQRRYLVRVEPRNPEQGFSYRHAFSWHADSMPEAAALTTLAGSGSSAAQDRVAQMRHEDSLRAADVGYTELSLSAFAAIASEAVALRAVPESLVVARGNRIAFDDVRVLVLNARGQVLGRTRALHISLPPDIIQFVPPSSIVAVRPGRGPIVYDLAQEIQEGLVKPIAPIQVPLIVTGTMTAAEMQAEAGRGVQPPARILARPAEVTDPHAPLFTGRALDADANTPLVCLRTLLEDGSNRVVALGHTDAHGAFSLRAPKPGTYHVTFEMRGWGSVSGAEQTVAADEVRQKDYPVRFDEMVVTSSDAVDPYGFQHAEPATMRSQVTASNPNPQAVAVGGITLGGSAARPILGLVFGTVPARTIFAQYAVDSTGKVDVRTIVVPPTTSANDRTSLNYTLPRIGYAPAHDAGAATCEMVRLQVELRPRGSG